MAKTGALRKDEFPEHEHKLERVTPANDNKKFEIPTAANDNLGNEEADGKFGKHFLNDFPHFTGHKGDVRAISAFRREFKLRLYDDLNVFVMMGKSRDISAERVFAEDDENDVVFYSTEKSIKRALEARGHDAKKMNLERKTDSEHADIFIMLDSSVHVSKRLLHNIEPRGWVLCRIDTANSLRARGTYHFKGAIEKNGSVAHSSRENDPTFWKNVQVDSDETFRSAPAGEGVVTYLEAAQKVSEAQDAGVRGMTDNIFKSYSKLIEMAEEQNPELVSNGETLLTLKLMRKPDKNGGEPVEKELIINTVMPTKMGQHDDKIIVMRKGPM